MPLAVVGQLVGLVVELSDSLHFAGPPVALISSSILVVKLSEAVLEAVEFEALVATALLIMFYHKLAFGAGPSGRLIMK